MCWALAHEKPTADAAGGAALYQQIKGLITQDLQAGLWKPGEVIPSEFELAARFKVSQGTVRKAIDELAAENLLVRRQGKGTFVATHSEQHVQYRFLRLKPDGGGEAGDAAERPAQVVVGPQHGHRAAGHRRRPCICRLPCRPGQCHSCTAGRSRSGSRSSAA